MINYILKNLNLKDENDQNNQNEKSRLTIEILRIEPNLNKEKAEALISILKPFTNLKEAIEYTKTLSFKMWNSGEREKILKKPREIKNKEIDKKLETAKEPKKKALELYKIMITSGHYDIDLTKATTQNIAYLLGNKEYKGKVNINKDRKKLKIHKDDFLKNNQDRES